MQRIIFLYGVIAGAVVIATITAGIALSESGEVPHAHSVWVGYGVMLVGLSLVFFGIRQYRDRHRGGLIPFGTAVLVGLGIAAVAGAVYVAGWELYIALSGHDFMASYAQSMLEAERANGATDAELAVLGAEMDTLSARYEKAWFRLPMTFLEIFPVGMLVTLVSAALLRRNPKRLPTG